LANNVQTAHATRAFEVQFGASAGEKLSRLATSIPKAGDNRTAWTRHVDRGTAIE
jgi:hypothetical protein